MGRNKIERSWTGCSREIELKTGKIVRHAYIRDLTNFYLGTEEFNTTSKEFYEVAMRMAQILSESNTPTVGLAKKYIESSEEITDFIEFNKKVINGEIKISSQNNIASFEGKIIYKLIQEIRDMINDLTSNKKVRVIYDPIFENVQKANVIKDIFLLNNLYGFTVSEQSVYSMVSKSIKDYNLMNLTVAVDMVRNMGEEGKLNNKSYKNLLGLIVTTTEANWKTGYYTDLDFFKECMTYEHTDHEFSSQKPKISDEDRTNNIRIKFLNDLMRPYTGGSRTIGRLTKKSYFQDVLEYMGWHSDKYDQMKFYYDIKDYLDTAEAQEFIECELDIPDPNPEKYRIDGVVNGKRD